MAYDIKTGLWHTDPLLDRLIAEKKSCDQLQMHKHEDWNDNYDLYRNKVKTNRLTQRQAVNIPLMKETIKTMLSKIDDAPKIDWMELGGNEDKEIIFQEIWDSQFRDNKLELIDMLDKKNVLLYGLSFTKLSITADGVPVSVPDVFDTSFDPQMLPCQIESARFYTIKNIFRSVREILADKRYTKKGKESLTEWTNSPPGMVQSEENRKQWEEKIRRLKDMGVAHQDFPLFAGGDRIVNLTEHYTSVWDTKRLEWQRRVCTYADNSVLLLNDPLKDLIGVDFWPGVVWSEDPETNDIYPDSVADLVRTPNKVMNVWFSQAIENRTLKNFQMHWFLPNGNYNPQTYTPGPGVMLPAPPGEDINKVIKPVEISGLDDTFAAIQYLTTIVERGTGATAIDKGVSDKTKQTLGEVEILVGKAQERAISMQKFYRMAWYERAWKWAELMHANAPKIIKLYKKGRSGKLYEKKVFASDWKSDAGYRPTVSSTSEQENEQTKGIQKYMFLLKQFPNNIALKKIAQKRMLEIVDFTPEELRQVEDAEEQVPQQGGEVAAPEDMADVENSVRELTSMITQ